TGRSGRERASSQSSTGASGGERALDLGGDGVGGASIERDLAAAREPVVRLLAVSPLRMKERQLARQRQTLAIVGHGDLQLAQRGVLVAQLPAAEREIVVRGEVRV